MAKYCAAWQGRQSHSSGVRKHGVFERCYTSLAQAERTMRTAAARRGSSALVVTTSYGLTQTLMTCRKGRCKVTSLGKKHGL